MVSVHTQEVSIRMNRQPIRFLLSMVRARTYDWVVRHWEFQCLLSMPLQPPSCNPWDCTWSRRSTASAGLSRDGTFQGPVTVPPRHVHCGLYPLRHLPAGCCRRHAQLPARAGSEWRRTPRGHVRGIQVIFVFLEQEEERGSKGT